ncbi:HET-domain-containing protein [Diaporthe amygdali]|uniref:HET-domain-containing protein n=1 Tax=Phomopsis amygdali TaxID=1214568 RepID=UPI0022FECE19|nr:HET-domain-containing protein [Diaporthe amygdali]KAJ0109966.1 HET-domain-containing protein [Diaporthe amygdali]
MVKRVFDEGLVREVDESGPTRYHPGITRELIEEWSVRPYRLHKSFRDLVASADGGCHSCATLVTRLDGQVDDARSDKAVYIENRPLFLPPDVRHVIGMFKMMALEPDLDNEADEGLPTVVVAVRAERDPEKPIFWDPTRDVAVEYLSFEIRGDDRLYHSRHIHWGRGNVRRQVSPIVDAGDNLKVISSWLQSCQTSDSRCSTSNQELFKPTRLIDVGDPGSSNGNPRLVKGDALEGESAAYVALSYCWGIKGQQHPWILTKEKLKVFEDGIPFDALPKTIADALAVTRANNIRYLWVDSICIVQDDPEDWEHEAYHMSRVYSNSLFTIISGSDSATGGLFLPRDQLKVSAAEVTIGPEAGSPTHQLVMYPSLVGATDTTGGGATSKRAWCYQEELLSARRLYFSKNQFQWACLCSQHNEAGRHCPGDFKSTSYTTPTYDAEILYSGSRVIGEWYNLVMEYTSRSLTYHGDIFAALAGIVAALKTKYYYDDTCRYLAGMWEDDMMHGILWQRVGSSLARPSEFQAPSWSWLSVQGSVIYGRKDPLGASTDAEFLGCEISTLNGNEFGTVAPGGKLRLRARLLSCEVAAVNDEQDIEKLHNTMQDLPVEETPLRRKKGSSRTESPDSADPDRQEAHEGEDVTDQGHDTMDDSEAGEKDDDEPITESEISDSDSDTGSGYVLRSAPWEAPDPTGPVRPPGNRLDMIARVRLSTGREFATVFFDGEEEAQTKQFFVAYINAAERPAGVMDRNGVALVPAESRTHEGAAVYRRIGFVAFWDKLLKGDGDLAFLDETEKTEIVLV